MRKNTKKIFLTHKLKSLAITGLDHEAQSYLSDLRYDPQ